MKHQLSAVFQITSALLLTGSMVHAMEPPTKPQETVQNVVSEIKAEEPVKEETKPAETPVAPVAAPEPVKVAPVPAPAPAPKPAPAPAPVKHTSINENENIAWNFLMAQGFTRNQTAGIMGNLQREHNFNTSDVPGGLGIAQWIGGRRLNLIAKGNYLDINVQLNFLMEELHSTEGRAFTRVKATTTLEAATAAFQDGFERCKPEYCNLAQRIQFAQEINARH